jgi:bacterioferritin-associated ferredoxin
MYVCLCNRITENEIRRHAATPAPTPASVYRAKGVAPRCGKCIPMVAALLREARPLDPEADGRVAPAA